LGQLIHGVGFDSDGIYLDAQHGVAIGAANGDAIPFVLERHRTHDCVDPELNDDFLAFRALIDHGISLHETVDVDDLVAAINPATEGSSALQKLVV